MKTVTHQADLCVIGGGLAGMCAAMAAARHGARVVLMHDRPVLGGNASSEVRMWICGAHGPNNRETGIVEEVELDNLHRNPASNFSIWDSVLYEKVRFQPGLTPLLNCSCCAAEVKDNAIRSATGWQLTTETRHVVEAALFADCSGDSILAPLSGAEFRVGREARGEFGEDIEPAGADRKTMGMSCLIQARETDHPCDFIPPAWAHKFARCEDLPNRGHAVGGMNNFWWLELGGDRDSIHDTEELRDELLKIAFGVWDHIKNHCPKQDVSRWALDWVGFLPGKRESRRYVGDHILTQNDVRAEGRFDDLVAYGGWSMDDHTPGGFRDPGVPTVFHPVPSPYGIPYRCLYSKNIRNLFFAGRNISATHAAISSTRVMATCATLGQAVGTAAALAARRSLSPRGVFDHGIQELKQALMDDDSYLPWNRREAPSLSRQASLSAATGDPLPLLNGVDRPVGAEDNGWTGVLGDWVEYRFSRPQALTSIRMVFDSDLNRKGKNIRSNYPLNAEPRRVPPSLVRAFRIDVLDASGNGWRTVFKESDNWQRLVRVAVPAENVLAVRLIPERTWGSATAHVFAFDVR